MNSPRSKLRGITSDLRRRSDKKDRSYPLISSLLRAAGNSQLKAFLLCLATFCSPQNIWEEENVESEIDQTHCQWPIL